MIFSDKSLSLKVFKVKLYNENSRFRKRNYSLSKLFPSNVQKISKLLCLEKIFGPKFLNGWNGIFEESENCQNRHNCYKTWFLPSNWQNKVRSTKCALSTSITARSKKWSITFSCFRVQLIWQFLRRMNFFLTCSYSRFQILNHFFPKHTTVSCHHPLNYPVYRYHRVFEAIFEG